MIQRSLRPAGIACVLAGALLTVLVAPAGAQQATVLEPDEIFDVKRAAEARISPDGKWVAYTVRSPRPAGDKAGPDYRELYVVSTGKKGGIRPFVTGKVSVTTPRWSPDGTHIAFRLKRGEKAKTQVWTIPVDGGEAAQVTRSKSNVLTYRWHPDGKHVAYVAVTPESKREKGLKDKGYGFVFFEENLKHRNLYLVSTRMQGDEQARQITDDLSIWAFEFSPDGGTIVAGASEKNLVDHRYVFQSLYLIGVDGGAPRKLTNNPGKIGNFAFSPDGTKVAYVAASERRDHAVSHLYVVAEGGEARDLTPPDFKGHVNRVVGWRDRKTVVYGADEGVWNSLNVVKAEGGGHRALLHSSESGVVFSQPTFTADFKDFAMIGTSADVPADVYHWTSGRKLRRLTTLNPWLAEKNLGRTEVVRYPARDGLEIEGLLYYPVGYQEGRRYPLVVVVHGGPESRYANGWNTFYSRPVGVLTGRGYLVFLPNYRSSAGYGVEFTEDHLGDPAGKEFDDIADGIDYLVDRGLADRDRVGLGGGSYGGFAAAWFSSYYTDYVKATCMFVGISNLVSKRSTTDIPYEELYVHSGKKLEEMWEKSLQRSPIYHAHQSRTAVLIYGGTADPRVHPSQSLEFYRRLKMNDHPAVRLVQYPGERHGNQKRPGQVDVLHRTLQWYDWYVKDAKPLDGPMPPLDISKSYGIDLGEE